MKIIDALTERKDYLHRLLGEKERALASAPPGHLRLSCRSGRPQYYQITEDSSSGGRYLSKKNTAGISELAQKDYNEKLCTSIRAEIRAIDRYLKSCPDVSAEDIYSHLPEPRQRLVVPVIETEEEFVEEWISRPYAGKEFHESSPEFYTAKGERVRSKSEVIIADMLYHKNIPYKYECPLYLEGMGIVYPDFTVLDVIERKEVYWEHMGRMDDPEYVDSAIRKWSCYIQNDHFEGTDMIYTYETREVPLNTRILQIKIRHVILHEEV